MRIMCWIAGRIMDGLSADYKEWELGFFQKDGKCAAVFIRHNLDIAMLFIDNITGKGQSDSYTVNTCRLFSAVKPSKNL